MDSTEGAQPVSNGDSRPLGEILVKAGLISSEQLTLALEEQSNQPAYLGQILMRHRWVNERDLFHHLAIQRGVEFIEVRDRDIPSDVVDRLPQDVALQLSVLPISYSDGVLRVAMEDPFNERLLKMVMQSVPEQLKPAFSTRSDLHYAINRAYNNLVRSNPLVRDYFDGFAFLLEQPEFDSNRLVDLSLALAHLLGSSDVHFYFGGSELRILLRIDGALHNIPLPTRRIRNEQIVQFRNTLKLRCGIDVSRKGVHQEGTLELDMEQGSIIASVSIVPLVDGEKAVLHLSGRLEVRSFDQIGLASSERAKILPLLKRASGLVIVSGPVGCGKTTSLYAMLEKIPTMSRNVMTIENHVEARLPFVAQIQLSKEKGYTTQAALLSAMDQDPDVIMIGELSDKESAAIAVESAMTGHLVLTSVKMESAAWVILHLLNLGVNALSLASTLRAIIAQRLVPRLCRDCRQPHPEEAEMIRLLNLPSTAKLFGSAGCPKCYYSGKSGRIAIFETIFVNDALRDLITSSPTISALAVHSKGAGARAFREDSLEKCLAGLIAPEDVLAVC